MTENEIRRTIWECRWKAYNEAPTPELNAYWIGKWPELEARGREINVPDYARRRLLGWQAGGADVATFGEFANPPTAYHPVPPFPGDAPPDSASPPPSTAPAPSLVMASIDARLERLETLVNALVQRLPPDYTGTIRLPPMLGGGTRTVLLRAIHRGNT